MKVQTTVIIEGDDGSTLISAQRTSTVINPDQRDLSAGPDLLGTQMNKHFEALQEEIEEQLGHIKERILRMMGG